MHFSKKLLIASSALILSACSYPRMNTEREAELKDIVEVVECELFAASTYFPNEVSPALDDKWDIGSTLDLTLVSRLDVDGKVGWAIPVNYSVGPSIGGSVQDTITAHVAFATDLSAVTKSAKAGKLQGCSLDNKFDPSGTGLGLTAWIRTTFEAVGKQRHGGLTYTKSFELRANAGARFGYIFAPVNVDAGASASSTKTNQLVVGISPRSGPQRVIVVSDQRKAGTGSEVTSASKVFNNPNLTNLLSRQAPLVLRPGQTLQIR